jgi:ubiquinone/menaquinone biosynthesis C-methylase UbiE
LDYLEEAYRVLKFNGIIYIAEPSKSYETEEEIIKLNHYTNFQPLWWEENMAKGAKGIGKAKEISYIIV